MRNAKLAILALGLMTQVSACATEWNVARRVEAKRVGPKTTPTRNITNFSAALRCMDRLMIEHGVERTAVLMEELTDQTGQVSAGTRDMVIAAVSDMTRRSRTIRVNAFGSDSGNLVSYISAAGRQAVYSDLPPYDIRGSISQFDRAVVSEQMGGGGTFSADGTVDGRADASMFASGSVMGLDLSVISTNDLSIVPGVFSRNSVVILESSKNLSSVASFTKSNINFNVTLSETEGTAQALRNLVELATLELFGRLFKLPYWSCLEIDPDHADVQREISDWFYSMETHGELAPYLQRQLSRRGYGDSLQESVPAYRSAADLEEGGLDLALFRSVLTRPEPEGRALVTLAHGQVGTGTRASAEGDYWPDEARAAGAGRPAWLPPMLQISANAKTFSPGEPLQLAIRSSGSGHLYCFYTDDRGQVVRFFPNRFASDGFVTADAVVEVPGEMPFEITASQSGVTELVSCFLTEQDILPWLPDPLGAADFEELGRISTSELRHSFRRAAGGAVGEAELAILVGR